LALINSNAHFSVSMHEIRWAEKKPRQAEIRTRQKQTGLSVSLNILLDAGK